MKSALLQRIVFVGIFSLLSSMVATQDMGKMNAKSARAEIEKLHQKDIAATVASNADELVALWSDDGVLISQGDRPLQVLSVFENISLNTFETLIAEVPTASKSHTHRRGWKCKSLKNWSVLADDFRTFVLPGECPGTLESSANCNHLDRKLSKGMACICFTLLNLNINSC